MAVTGDTNVTQTHIHHTLNEILTVWCFEITEGVNECMSCSKIR